MTQPAHQRGAALLMLMVVFGLLGAMFAVQQFGDASKEGERTVATRMSLGGAIDSLMGYAMSRPGNPFLPCPDTTNDGLEDRNVVTGACLAAEGNLPWATLGFAGLDAWGNRLRYRVTPGFSNSLTGFGLASTGILTINNRAGALIAGAVPFVVLSHGANRWGARTSAGGATAPPPATNTNEVQNTNGNTIFVSDSPALAGAVGGEFDDVVSWLSSAQVIARMQQAGKL